MKFMIAILATAAAVGASQARAADETVATPSDTIAQEQQSELYINRDTREVVRVNADGTATPVTQEEIQALSAKAHAQDQNSATENEDLNALMLRGGGHGGGFGGGRGFGGGGFGRGGFGHGGFGRGGFGGGFGRGGFGRGGFGFGRGGFGRGWGRRGWGWGGGWLPFVACDPFAYDPYYCY